MAKRYYGNDLILGTDEEGTPCVLTADARSGHSYISGRTGSGKSRTIASCIRQDITNWKRTKCGLLLLDPHGEIVDSVLAWLALTPRYKRMPIVVIDLGRDDWLVGYSPLRQREGISPAVAAAQFVEGMLHAFGQVDPSATPTISRVLSTIVQALLYAGRALPDVFTLLDPDRMSEREMLLSKITDPVTRADLERLHRLSRPRFEEEVLGPVNRLSAFLKNPLLRTILAQSERSFNFDWAIKEGAIVLVSLASRGSKITESDGKLFASLMLTDLWQAATARGKRGAGGVKPFYVYIDEASSLCTPTIAKNLDQARGFGLHLTLANQMLSQFESYGGAYGRAIRKSVIANTLNKICFRQSTDEEDLTPLVRALFLGEFDPCQVKHTLTSFQTVGYEEEERWTNSETITAGRTQGKSVGTTRTESWNETDTWATNEGGNGTEGISQGTTRVTAFADSGVVSESYSDSWSESEGWSWSENAGGSSQSGGSESVTEGTSTQRSSSTSRGRQQQFVQRPILEERLSTIQYYSLPEQFLQFEQQLVTLKKREAIVVCDGVQTPTKLQTLEVKDLSVRPEWIEKFRADTMAQHPFWVTHADALKQLAPTIEHASMPQSLKGYGRRSISVTNVPVEETEEEQ